MTFPPNEWRVGRAAGPAAIALRHSEIPTADRATSDAAGCDATNTR